MQAKFPRGALLLLGLAPACGGGKGTLDSGIERIDSAPLAVDATEVCPTEERIEIGACDAPESEFPCMGFEENLVFVPLSQGDPVTPVVGFQGIAMFVFGFRVSGVDPGPQDAPLERPTLFARVQDETNYVVSETELKPRLLEIETGRYEGFEVQLPYPGEFDQYDGVDLRASFRMTDRGGVLQCGVLEFVGTKSVNPQL
jgi:hypothetical protein